MLNIEPCPKAGQGVNAWVNTNVLRMLRARFSNADIYSTLIAHAKGCGRDIRRDITRSIDTGRLFLGMGKGFSSSEVKAIDGFDEVSFVRDLSKKFCLNPEYQTEVLRENCLVNTQNWPSEGPRKNYPVMEILYRLFGSNKICLGYNQHHSIIAQLTSVNSIFRFENKHIRLGLCQFIVPTPMENDYALNESGKRSIRCLGNTAKRWFLVIEFDRISSQDDQFRLHYELAKSAELRMLVFSGNKSIHGWYNVYRKPVEEVKSLMSHATTLGADPMTWIRCQYVRFPGGTNSKTKTRQEILYYNYGK